MSKKSKKNQKWGVFEFATGVLWQVNPPTKENAEDQARAVAEEGYHEVVPLKWGWHMSNAFNHGKAQERSRVK